MKAYVVGGAVRDELLGLPVQDRDHVVVGATPEEMVARDYQPVGKDFPVFLHPKTHEEYALARTERKSGRGYKGFVVHAAPDVTLEDDLRRRDLTINAIAKDPESGELIDPFRGQEDLQKRILRHVSEAFAEDPVRILRVARFAARFGFDVAPETKALMQQMVASGEADYLVPERVWQEFSKGLGEKYPHKMFEVLRESGLLARLLPEVLDIPLNFVGDVSVRFAVLTASLGERAVESISTKLRAPNEVRELAALVARNRDLFSRATSPTELLDLLKRADAFRRPERFSQLLEVIHLVDPAVDIGRIEMARREASLVPGSDIAASAISSQEIPALLDTARVRAVRFKIDVHDTEIVGLLNELISITGHAPWARKFLSLSQQLKQNPFLAEFALEHHGIELKFQDLLFQQERDGIFPVKVQDPSHYELYGFASGFVRIYRELSKQGKTRLKGMLLDGLKPDNSLLALHHEIITAVHLIGRGYELQMNDLERGHGVDFVARRNGLELEVECKMFSGDLGRKLHRRKVLAMHNYLAETVAKTYRSASTGKLVRITLPDRLHCTADQLAGIKETVKSALLGSAIARSDFCDVEVVDFNISDSPFTQTPDSLGRQEIEAFVAKKVNRFNKEMMILFSPCERAVIVIAESAKPDEVLKGAYRQLRESAGKQFTKSRPGILVVQFQDLSADDMESIARSDSTDRQTATGLQLMTSHFLNAPHRSHIHTVLYRSHGKLLTQDESSGQSSIRESGIAYVIRNPNNPFHDDPRSRAFSA